MSLSVPAETDRRAECAEPSSAGEVKFRGEQEEVRWKKSGTLFAYYPWKCIYYESRFIAAATTRRIRL